MADTIKIQLSDIYEPITPEDVRTAKNYVLRREQACRGLSSLIDAFLKDAADKITRICYRHGVDPRTFTISSVYNDKMFDEVAAVLDQLEEDILDLVTDYATRCTESERRKASLLPWIALLGRNNKGLRRTLEDRLWVFSRDLEAMIAATRLAKLDVTTAANRIISNLHTVYVMPEVLAAIKSKQPMQATYIKSGGVKHGNVGNSNSEANNIIRFGEITVQMAWMRNLRERYNEEGAAGFIVQRGSTYPCENICDPHVGFHRIDETEHFPPFHGHCRCFAIPVYKKKEIKYE